MNIGDIYINKHTGELVVILDYHSVYGIYCEIDNNERMIIESVYAFENNYIFDQKLTDEQTIRDIIE